MISVSVGMMVVCPFSFVCIALFVLTERVDAFALSK